MLLDHQGLIVAASYYYDFINYIDTRTPLSDVGWKIEKNLNYDFAV